MKSEMDMKRFHYVGIWASACAVANFLSPFCAAAGEPLGLVLSGGGAKGAYEVGVWETLEAAGVAKDVVAISGTSVGALNAALFATLPESAEALWRKHMPEVFTMNTNRVRQSLQTSVDQAATAIERYNQVKQETLAEAAERLGVPVDDLPAEEIEAAEKSARLNGIWNLLLSVALRIGSDVVELSDTDAPREGYVDSAKLANAIDEALPRNWSEEVPAVYATALEKGGRGVAATWRLNDEPHERRNAMIRASAAIPMGFDTVAIDGKTYEDGGDEDRGGNNVPLEPILAKHPEIKTVMVVYLADEKHLNRKRFEANRAAAEAAGVRLVEIVPTEDIGGWFDGWQGTLDFRPDTARELMDLGRKDSERVLEEWKEGGGE